MGGAIEMLQFQNMIDSPSDIAADAAEFSYQGPLHWHDYYSFDIILSGEGLHRINGESILLRPGDVYFVRPTDIHAICGPKENPLRLITTRTTEARVPEKFRSLLRRRFVTLHPEKHVLDRLTMYAEAIMDCAEQLQNKSGNPGYLTRSAALHWELILLTYADLLEREAPGSFPAPAEQNADDPVFADAVRYLDAHFLEELTVKDVAAAVGLSPAYFSTRFKQAVGCSCVEYLTRRRLNYACSLLSDGANVSDACFSSGFGSLSFFEEVFKKYVGMTPGKYRAMQGK